MNGDLNKAIALVDGANKADPNMEEGRPEALLYGERMSAEMDRLFPDASDVLKIAARGQHVERWKLPRKDFPEGRAGYYAWRKEQGRRHGERVAGLMAEAGYNEEAQTRVGVMLRKEGIKQDAEVQALEDVICFVFLKWYFSPFADSLKPEALPRIVERTAAKMSAEGRARALAEFDLPEPFAGMFRD
ncbi:DUF4202 domain-containing protein [Pelagimonas varians]|mgnify:CR=1 FL=1|uniref:DUF4202 domain-containing protein n=1 Tax=Pelagimonas varians TaxID=696760 RepID=A0A238K1U1_9RHOB|nr:DUF4202 domain-containing protein [Pelagimonas varians]PYG33342.1 uncharacterized protein DUF4202 [Pelagimonas varians]SMX36417.1 hypothetical protein PEV8663_00801 [Pelagimonas varians]